MRSRQASIPRGGARGLAAASSRTWPVATIRSISICFSASAAPGSRRPRGARSFAATAQRLPAATRRRGALGRFGGASNGSYHDRRIRCPRSAGGWSAASSTTSVKRVRRGSCTGRSATVPRRSSPCGTSDDDHCRDSAQSARMPASAKPAQHTTTHSGARGTGQRSNSVAVASQSRTHGEGGSGSHRQAREPASRASANRGSSTGTSLRKTRAGFRVTTSAPIGGTRSNLSGNPESRRPPPPTIVRKTRSGRRFA